MTDRPDITPRTKVADLLRAYPQLEEILVELAPAFKALRNPVLRRTVAKVTTLSKAASVANVDLTGLISHLRREVGLEPAEHGAGANPDTAVVAMSPEEKPAWADDDSVGETIHADSLLARGEVPLEPINRALRSIPPGRLVCVESSFAPAPLTDALQRKGHEVCIVQTGPRSYRTYIAGKKESGC